jgi:hypothetical protein
MPVVTLNLRDLKSGQRMLADFETLDACVEWLRARPRFVDVLGPTDEHISVEVDQMLRSALRPLDEDERNLVAERQQRQAAELAAAHAERCAEVQAQVERKMASLGPDDAMHVSWVRGGAVVNAEPMDQRAVPRVVVDAVALWVAERNEWVHARGQRVRAVSVVVWPGAVPAGEERVHPGGQFEIESLAG